MPCHHLNAGVSVATGAASLRSGVHLWVISSVATNMSYIDWPIGKSFLWSDNCTMYEV